MLQIGKQIPSFRALGIVQGELSWLNSWQLIADHWAAFCFVPQLCSAYRRILDDSSRSFEEAGAHLVIVAPDQDVLCNPWSLPSQQSKLIILEDPIQRLHRMFRVTTHARSRCTTFVIDPTGMLQVPLIHDPDSRSLEAVLELVRAYQRQDIMRLPHARHTTRAHDSRTATNTQAPDDGDSSYSRLRHTDEITTEEAPRISQETCTQ